MNRSDIDSRNSLLRPVTVSEHVYMNNSLPLLSHGDKTRAREKKSQLPHDFEPFPYSVLIGRGKACTEATGNKRLKVIASTFLDEYRQAAESRIEKSIIVSKIVDMVRDATPRGAFIKQEDGVWWEVSDHAARERVGSMLRDLLHEQYRSSSKSKLAKRKSQSFEDVKPPKTLSSTQPAKLTQDTKQPPIYTAKVSSSSATSSMDSSGDGFGARVQPSQALTSRQRDKTNVATSFQEPTTSSSIAERCSSNDDAPSRIGVEDVLRRNQHSTGLNTFPAMHQFPLDPTRQSMHHGSRLISQHSHPFDVFAEHQQMLELQLQQNQQEQQYLRQRQMEQQQQQQSQLCSVPSFDFESLMMPPRQHDNRSGQRQTVSSVEDRKDREEEKGYNNPSKDFNS